MYWYKIVDPDASHPSSVLCLSRTHCAKLSILSSSPETKRHFDSRSRGKSEDSEERKAPLRNGGL